VTPEAFREATGVSPETLSRFETYRQLLVRWNRRVNLVGAASLDDPWRRHFYDSAQLFPLIPETCARLVDLGAGAGFPGLVLAIMGVRGVELIEANGRKCAFLREVARATATQVTVIQGRIGNTDAKPADVVTARACAPLGKLLGYVDRFLSPGGTALLLKGARVEEELTQAGKSWTMDVNRRPSLSDPAGSVLEITNLRPTDVG
jgi:16S rRNA (guanine527-N7)-methyltransferase